MTLHLSVSLLGHTAVDRLLLDRGDPGVSSTMPNFCHLARGTVLVDDCLTPVQAKLLGSPLVDVAASACPRSPLT
jgi:hypothetical protein